MFATLSFNKTLVVTVDFVNKVALFCVFSERDGHTQAVEEHRASFEESHADGLSSRSLQVFQIKLISSHFTIDL